MLQELNTYYKPDFEPKEGDQFITLTSHNRNADDINGKALANLAGKMLNLKAVVKDEFSQGAYPAEEILSLKIGAQVMFIRNDTGEDRKYYNGKIGTVKDINLQAGTVVVTFPDGSEEVTAKRETWENIKYNYDKGQDQIKEEVLGTFSQFPLRLAWAITIHKSIQTGQSTQSNIHLPCCKRSACIYNRFIECQALALVDSNSPSQP